MAKITRSLDDIEKLVKKAHQTPKEQLKEVQEELARQKSININGLITDKEKLLIEAEKILFEQIEEEENKKELNRIKLSGKLEKQTKKEIKEELYSNINSYFNEYKQPAYQKKIYELLHYPEVIDDEVLKITNIYGEEFKQYTTSIYIKTIDEVYKLYKYRINEAEKQEKLQMQAKTQKLKNSLAFQLGVAGILTLASKKKNYRR